MTDPDKSGRLPITHWIMLGLSETGGFNGEDLKYTNHFKTIEEKQEANSKEIKKRLTNSNLIELFQNKLLRVWGDGSDECFDFNRRDTTKHTLFSFINGNRNIVFVIYVQAYRALMFFAIILAVLWMLFCNKKDDLFLFALTLLGAMTFFLIWEANVKYSISFIFVLLILMGNGIQNVEMVLSKEKTGKVFISENMRTKIYYSLVILCIAALLVNIQLMITKMDNFTERKYSFTNYTFEGTRKVEARYNKGILGENMLAQTFVTDNAFNRVEVIARKLNTKEKSTVYTMSLLGEQGELIATSDFTVSDLSKENLIQLKCNVKRKKEVHKYQLTLRKKNSGGDTLAFGELNSKEFDYINDGVLTVNDVAQQEDLYLQVYEKTEQTYTSKKRYLIIYGAILMLQIGTCGLMFKRNRRE